MVLCYHAVSEQWSDQLAVSPAAIEKHIRALLRRGFQLATAAQAVAGGGKLLHITFDDAYRSIRCALPLLESMGVPVTVFACADYANDGRPLDVLEVRALADAYPEEMATMGWNELRELSERGVEIGSHTITHPHLTSLSDTALEQELVGSRTRFQAELGRPCRFLAYPYGEQDERVRRAARKAGYEAAFCLGMKTATKTTDDYALPRVDLYRKDHLLRMTLKTSFLSLAARAFRF